VRKVDIRSRVQQLDEALRIGRATLARQRDERAQLTVQCQAAGDHVFVTKWFATHGPQECCMFCGQPEKAGEQQIARNLVRG
jgi:hypothetical protein